jgi:hypothetical protein
METVSRGDKMPTDCSVHWAEAATDKSTTIARDKSMDLHFIVVTSLLNIASQKAPFHGQGTSTR